MPDYAAYRRNFLDAINAAYHRGVSSLNLQAVLRVETYDWLVWRFMDYQCSLGAFPVWRDLPNMYWYGVQVVTQVDREELVRYVVCRYLNGLETLIEFGHGEFRLFDPTEVHDGATTVE